MIVLKIYLLIAAILSVLILLSSKKSIKYMKTGEVVLLFLLSPLLAIREVYYLYWKRKKR